MKKWWRAILASSLWLHLSLAIAGAAKKAEALKHVADPEKAGNTLYRWLALTYNDNKLFYSIICLVTMAVMGCVLGYLVDLFLAKIGFETKKIDHLE
jgi:hypothetical protein